MDLLKTFATQSALAIQNARLFREIAEKGRQLEVASQHKSQFLASMSHELRTPLNALLGFNEMILGEVYGEVPGDMKPPLARRCSRAASTCCGSSATCSTSPRSRRGAWSLRSRTTRCTTR